MPRRPCMMAQGPRTVPRSPRRRHPALVHDSCLCVAQGEMREAAMERGELQRKLDDALAALLQQQQAGSSVAGLGGHAASVVPLEQLPELMRAASVKDDWPTGAW